MSPSQANQERVRAAPDGLEKKLVTSASNEMVSKEEYHASGTGELLPVMPMEPVSDALDAGTVANTPNVERRSIKTKPMLARWFGFSRGFRSLIISSSHA